MPRDYTPFYGVFENELRTAVLNSFWTITITTYRANTDPSYHLSHHAMRHWHAAYLLEMTAVLDKFLKELRKIVVHEPCLN